MTVRFDRIRPLHASLLAIGLSLLAATALAQTPQAGDLDLTFNPGTGIGTNAFSGQVSQILLQPDGEVVVAGAFTAFNGVSRTAIARLHPSGALDNAFNPRVTHAQGSVEITSLARQANGQILLAGQLDSVNGYKRYALARLNASGSLDQTFNPTIEFDQVECVAVQSDGRILICGFFQSVNGVRRESLARLNSNGSLDTTFDAGSTLRGFPDRLLLLPDGGFYVWGFFDINNDQTHEQLARFRANGALDPSFSSRFRWPDRVGAVAIQTDGRLLVLGDFDNVGGVTRYGAARLNADGSLNTSYVLGGSLENQVHVSGYTVAVALQTDGKALIAGSLSGGNGLGGSGLRRFLTNGAADPSWREPEFWGDVAAIQIAADGKIYLGGSFTELNGVSRHGIARLLGAPPPPPPPPPPPNVGLVGMAGTDARLRLRGQIGDQIVLDVSSDLKTWTPLTTMTLTTTEAEVTDASAGDHTSRFYRARRTGP